MESFKIHIIKNQGKSENKRCLKIMLTWMSAIILCQNYELNSS